MQPNPHHAVWHLQAGLRGVLAALAVALLLELLQPTVQGAVTADNQKIVADSWDAVHRR